MISMFMFIAYIKPLPRAVITSSNWTFISCEVFTIVTIVHSGIPSLFQICTGCLPMKVVVYENVHLNVQWVIGSFIGWTLTNFVVDSVGKTERAIGNLIVVITLFLTLSIYFYMVIMISKVDHIVQHVYHKHICTLTKQCRYTMVYDDNVLQ